MAFNAIERLKEGRADFLVEGWITTSDMHSLIKAIRKQPNKEEIIDAFLSKIINSLPSFCFEMIYDNDKFKAETIELLNSEKYEKTYKFNNLDAEKIENILNKTSWGEEYVFNNLDYLMLDDELNKINILISFIYNKSCYKDKWINKFIKNKDMYKRAIFIEKLIELYPVEAEKLLEDFESIVEQRAEIGEQLSFFLPKINDKDLSRIVIACLYSNINKKIFEQIKDYLITNYQKNDVAELLLHPKMTNEMKVSKEVFAENADQLFLTSRRYQFYILSNYKELISAKIIQQYNKIIELNRFFIETPSNYIASPIYRIYEYELGDEFKRIVDQYLSLSSCDFVNYMGRGSMSCSFQLGDYVLKIGRGKWSYEDVICPNLYLILKNLEEFYVRNENEIVIANMEVQPLLRKNAKNLPRDAFVKFHRELHNLGYYTDDPRSNSTSGENFGILDSYKDANCNNPEKLPEYFKKLPLVLYDRDRIFKVGKRPKVLVG